MQMPGYKLKKNPSKLWYSIWIVQMWYKECIANWETNRIGRNYIFFSFHLWKKDFPILFSILVRLILLCAQEWDDVKEKQQKGAYYLCWSFKKPNNLTSQACIFQPFTKHHPFSGKHCSWLCILLYLDNLVAFTHRNTDFTTAIIVSHTFWFRFCFNPIRL